MECEKGISVEVMKKMRQKNRDEKTEGRKTKGRQRGKYPLWLG